MSSAVLTEMQSLMAIEPDILVVCVCSAALAATPKRARPG